MVIALVAACLPHGPWRLMPSGHAVVMSQPSYILGMLTDYNCLLYLLPDG